MKKIFLGLILFLFLITSATGFLKPLNLQEQTIVPVNDTKGMSQSLCTGEMNWALDDYGNPMYYYNGDPLTEEAGICNARVTQRVLNQPIDQNITIEVSPFSIGKFLGATYPNGQIGIEKGIIWRIGRYITADFNWNKDTNYCFTERFTTRSRTGQYAPLIGGAYDRDTAKFNSYFYRYDPDPGQWTNFDVDGFYMAVSNINKPLIDFETDENTYTLPYGETDLQILLTITDDDLLCGKPTWGGVPSSFIPKYKSPEVFQIKFNGQDLNSIDENSGTFGADIIQGTNQGELTITIDTSEYSPGEYDFEIQVTDIDGYHEKGGTLAWPTVEPFIIEAYGNTITKTIHLTKEGSGNNCTPYYDKYTGMWIDCPSE